MSKTKSKSEKASGKSPEQAPVAAPATRLGDAEAQARLAVLRAQMEKQYGKGIIQNLSAQISNQRFAYQVPSGSVSLHGVLPTGQDPADPIRNRTRLSRTRSELLAVTGSRYSPASVCDGLGLVESAPSPCVIVGRPSEIAAVRNAARLRPELDRNVGVILSFFCAESPSTRGTIELLESLGVDPASVLDLRYRGHGWPGHFAPMPEDDLQPELGVSSGLPSLVGPTLAGRQRRACRHQLR